ncbi:DUF1775 domain-containing protein, partial [Phytoactinopolyspora endophytica]|uniref:DUF1775 domain-containing protein n=1 Tax=Phytoactinopolyspora endophytica TaxID=1642495 RepID=UPI00101DCCFA
MSPFPYIRREHRPSTPARPQGASASVRRRQRAAVRAAAGLGGAVALVAGLASVAAAHVSVSPDEAPAGSYTVLTFAVPHGCDGAATTEVAIDIPDGVLGVTPTVNPNWDVEQLNDDGSSADGEPASQIVYAAHEP